MAAQIDPPALPPLLYRYRDVSTEPRAKRELKAISSNYLWCSPYQKLNDPMEGIYGASVWLTRQPKFKELVSEIRSQKRSVGICCLSDTYESELMWAHYAGNHSGMCVAYSTRDLRHGLDSSVHIARVAYDEGPPKIGRDFQNCPSRAARTILSHKKASWLYEREWRLLSSQPGRLDVSGKHPVKAVYFGARMDSEIRDLLQKKLTNMKVKTYDMNVWTCPSLVPGPVLV